MSEIYHFVMSVELFSTYKNQRLFNFTEEKLRCRRYSNENE